MFFLLSIEKLNKRHGDIDIVDYCLLSEYSIFVTDESKRRIILVQLTAFVEIINSNIKWHFV